MSLVLFNYDKEQWKREKEILLASKQWYMDEIADREKKINELIQAKSDGARNLLDCQNECHALRLAADRTRHEADVQARLMQAKEAQVDQLQQRVHQCAHERDETEARAAQYARAHDELLQQTEQLQAEHRQAAEAWERETQRQLDEQRAKIVGELSAQNAAELDRVQTEARNAQLQLKKCGKRRRKLIGNWRMGAIKCLKTHLRTLSDRWIRSLDAGTAMAWADSRATKSWLKEDRFNNRC
ncbi:hypothetical protein niasHS_012589 [Heterodera schachtii]|uniref:Uncharacterized protein n=1 Tax=Heterodera schachtii TaxID=97005 RepID=A0ABD2I6L8_HETSC